MLHPQHSSASNPIVALLEKWCEARNRETYVAHRAWLLALAVLACLFVGRTWQPGCVAIVGVLCFSFLSYPPCRLETLLREQSCDFVPDRLLMLIAESPDIDAVTKVELAYATARRGGIKYYELTDAAGRAGLRRAGVERITAAGYVALTSLVPQHDEVD
jgi:hypothetical protein